MGIPAAIVGGAAISALAGGKAASAQEAAANSAANVEYARLAEEQKRYKEMKPYRTAGLESVKALGDIFGGRTDPTAAIQADPGYQFRLSQGQTALDRFLSARGNRLGGAALKEATRYNQGFASNEYQNMLNNRFRLAGFSGTPTPVSSASGVSNAIMAGGNAQAGAYQGLNQAAQGGLQNYTTYKIYNDWMNKLPNPTTTFSGNGPLLSYGN
ncbi:MAG TPA: hypothetical protein VJ742_08585 [Nitrososphaera sp.]|nr:hypothetical protein [Nitrososphaera sp.]